MLRLSRRLLLSRNAIHPPPSSHTRPFHPAPLRLSYKDDQDRTTLKPHSTEYTGSGTDDEAAHTAEAFDPSDTSPESEIKRKNGTGRNKDELDVSPGNKELSDSQKRWILKEDSARAAGESDTGPSKSGDAPKEGGGQYGG
ncbi:hypothetical protein P152DRAFT_463001 [Eremomyces bilateralis CBS 781.70]|uniref:Uncharacterized protein n=1 Tax=Eremomyces bilateralis CBS 781.70 TaxID=1392243 RepID=A0A6G1FQE5_9PEZI|nr:uncharacterized protein P152DRAFT_463001 [Eremomyces bilateralis CBS 781.70]KAF1807983.1 hypothetical protein P152DRAFT_463001 [Eremomyces bilateralis CBS 781.70]